MIRLGAGALCWHLRLERRLVTAEEVPVPAAEAAAKRVQTNLRRVDGRGSRGLRAPAHEGDPLGLGHLASGDFPSATRHRDSVWIGVDRVGGWRR